MPSLGGLGIRPGGIERIMDKNTVIAFILIGLVIILTSTPLYQKLIGGDPNQDKDDRQTTGEDRPTEVVQKEAARNFHSPDPYKEISTRDIQEAEEHEWSEDGTQAELYDPQEVFEATDITVENEVFMGTISTKGGGFTSLKLKKFEGQDGGWVELIEDGGGGPTLLLEVDGNVHDLSDVEFIITDRDHIFVEKGQEREITFTADLRDGRKIERRLTIKGDRYDIGLKVNVVGFGEDVKCALNWAGGIAITEADTAQDLTSMKAYTFMGGEVEQFEIENKEEGKHGRLDWIGVRNRYFFICLAPLDGRESEARVSGYVREHVSGYSIPIYNFTIASDMGEDGQIDSFIYMGPISYPILRDVGPYGLDGVIDWGWPFLQPILKPISSKVLIPILIGLYDWIPNYGVVIIIFSILVKIAVYPLTAKSYQSMSKMQSLQPKMAELKEKYKDDKQRQSQEMMKLYKEQGVNPMGGCWPMLLQMPIFIALYTVFSSTIELRKAEFALWLQDLSAPDPYYVLPVLMGITMFIQQKMTMKDPKQAAMVYIMPVVMVFIFKSFSAGLVLYWTMFNIFSGIQQLVIQPKLSKVNKEEPVTVVKQKRRGKSKEI